MAIHGLDDGSPIKRANVRQIAPMTALVSGPTNAIQNSTFALIGFFLNLRNAAESEKRNLLHRQLVRRRHQRVRQLVKEKRNEEQDGRRNRHGQDDAIAPLRDCWHGTARRAKTR